MCTRVSPAPTTAFIATISKGGVFAFFLRAAIMLDIPHRPCLFTAISLLAVISMFVGNLLALQQQNLKRLLAYSSISHMGYLLMTVLAFRPWAVTAAILYLAAYFIAILAAFGVMIALSAPGREAETLDDYRGLYWRRPWLALVLTLSMLSLAGIPLTAGVYGKAHSGGRGRQQRVLGNDILTHFQQRHQPVLLSAGHYFHVFTTPRGGIRASCSGCHAMARLDRPGVPDDSLGVDRGLSFPVFGTLQHTVGHWWVTRKGDVMLERGTRDTMHPDLFLNGVYDSY